MLRPLLVVGIIALGLVSATAAEPVIPDIQWWASLGVGGLIAVLVLTWKRADDKEYAAALKEHAAQLAQMNNRIIDLIVKHTETTQKLVSLIESQQNRQRKFDPSGGVDGH